MDSQRFRQIHLDFHTSEKIPGIGSEFCADEFVATLQRARVNSITCFSRCHHGLIYHDTRFPARHPHLTCNLLAEQIEACHKHDIRVPIYVTVGLDEYMAAEHPEWIEVDQDGKRTGAPPLAAGWRKLCFASPYIDYVIEQVEEVLDMFGDEVDGIFLDIINQRGVHGKWAMAEFAKLGWDPTDPAAQKAMRQHLVDQYKERMTAAIRAKNRTCTIFHNSGHIYPSWRGILHTYSHLELESLPSGGWGYAHFPVTMRYSRTLGLDCLGMTGKFAKTWGHFSSFKPQAALEYECFNMLALGAKCSVGDQLHPRGRLDEATYSLIGAVYEQVEAKEPWCDGVEPLVEIGVFNVEAVGTEDARVDSSAHGALRMLQEGAYQFNFIDQVSDWSAYELVILPDKVPVDEALAEVINAYLAGGGKMIVSGASGLTPAGDRFAIDGMPATYLEPLPFCPDFLKPLGDLAAGTLPTEYVMYERGCRVAAAPGAEVLGEIWVPYFNRSYEHFCSHNHTPVDRRSEDPGVLANDQIIYFAHPVFCCLAKHGMPFYKTLVHNALRRLLPAPLVQTDGPCTLEVSWLRQPAERRSVVHLLHYIPEKKTQAADLIEDVIPLSDLTVSLRCAAPSRAYLAPQGTALPVQVKGDRVELTLPRLDGHQMVVLDD